jgi:hypothetical protein
MSDDEPKRRRASSMMPYDPDNGWSDDIEVICEAIRENAAVMSDKHKKLYMYYNGQLKYYKIPVIIISGFNSVIAVGLQPYLEQGLISASNCLLALLCGIIGSIELFLGIQTSMETEMAASKSFYLLSVSIFRTLSLEREHRGHPGKEYLEEVYTEYSKLFENSALIQSKMKDSLAVIPALPSRTRERKGGGSPRGYSPDSTPSGSPTPQLKSGGGLLGLFRGKSSTPPREERREVLDPAEMLELGRANMLKPDQIQYMGNDLLAGGGFMKDLAPLQRQIHTATSLAAGALHGASALDAAGGGFEAMKQKMFEEAKKEALAAGAEELRKIKEEAQAAALQAGADELQRTLAEAAKVKADTEEAITQELSVATQFVDEVIEESLEARKLEEGKLLSGD